MGGSHKKRINKKLLDLNSTDHRRREKSRERSHEYNRLGNMEREFKSLALFDFDNDHHSPPLLTSEKKNKTKERRNKSSSKIIDYNPVAPNQNEYSDRWKLNRGKQDNASYLFRHQRYGVEEPRYVYSNNLYFIVSILRVGLKIVRHLNII